MSQAQPSELLLASLAKRESDLVDWDGQYKPYSGAMMQHKLTGEVVPSMRPKPSAITPENPQYDVVHEAYRKSQAIMRKPSNDEIFKMLYELTLHTADKRLSDNEYKLKFSGMAKDLSAYPASLIRETLEGWRKRPETPLYFPTTGQLQEEMHYRHTQLKKVFKRISVIAGKEVEEEQKTKKATNEMNSLYSNLLDSLK